MRSSSLHNILANHQNNFHPVVKFYPATDKLIQIDLGEKNKELNPDIFSDIEKFTRWINEKISSAGARYGIGGYAEHRAVYSSSRVFDAHKEGEEPRRFHLGTDIWGKHYTPVMSPHDGIVHSFAFNNQPGDYGVTIILTHNLDKHSFFTLYGHLSLSSIKNLQEGQTIEKGESFAEFGIPAENGQWPPHLHFQVIEDVGSWKGDYPGVCSLSESNSWLANSADPDIILQLNRYLP